MYRKMICMLLILCMAGLFSCCAHGDLPENSLPIGTDTPGNNQPQDGTSSQNDGKVSSDTRTESEKKAQELLDKMTMEEKIGQMLMVGFVGEKANDDISSLIKNYKIGGVILFKQNISGVGGVIDLNNSLKSLNSDQIPLFFSVDEEGGRVSRQPNGVTKLPAAKTIGDRGNTEIAYEAGAGVARQLKMLGYNIDFAPDTDIPIDMQKGVIQDRAYGDSANVVAQMSSAMVLGMKKENVIACVKHFPGHGNTTEDSHEMLPVINSTLQELTAWDLIPFKTAIDNGVDMIMAGHIKVPALDQHNGASTSSAILQDLLRDKLGYRGIIITDEMSMGAITTQSTVPDATVLAVKAGVDIVLIAGDIANQTGSIDALISAVRSGEISKMRINESVFRILEVKCRYGLSNDSTEMTTAAAVNTQLNQFNILMNQK